MNDDQSVDDLRSEMTQAAEDLRPSLTDEQNSLIDRLTGAADSLADAAEKASGGSCELAEPYAPIFMVHRYDGAWVWRCGHNPAHPDFPAHP